MVCEAGQVPNGPRQQSPLPATRDVPPRPFPREAYVFGWLTICVIAALGINALVSGFLGTGIIFMCLVPLMVWTMHIRPRGRRHRNPRG